LAVYAAVDEEGRTIGLLMHTAATESASIVRADEKLTASLELEAAICLCG